MISTWVLGDHAGIVIDFIRMRYSSSVAEIGRVRARKILHLFRVVGRATLKLLRGSGDVIYYPPAGAGRVPILRDIMTLLVLRRFGRPIVFHFHAMGLEDAYRSLGRLSRALFRAAFSEPDLCICPASSNLKDIAFLKPKATSIVPYGIPELEDGPPQAGPAHGNSGPGPSSNEEAIVLFIGNLIPTKGIWRLLRLSLRLEEAGVDARVVMVGAPPSDDIWEEYTAHPAVTSGRAVFTGPLVGADKLAWLEKADLFCFPSLYESENFPVVLLEALRSGLPIVSSRWRGIPEIVEDGVSGFLVAPEDEGALFERVTRLLMDPELRSAMREEARSRYLGRFTAQQYVRDMDRAICQAAKPIATEEG